MLTIALFEPEIPPNTGNIARMCAATGIPLHLIGNLGFSLSDAALKRAGLDYWHLIDITHFPDAKAYFTPERLENIILFSAHAKTIYTDIHYTSNSILLFGSETKGVAKWVKELLPETQFCTIPMINTDNGMRCINLATSTGIGAYEAIRQLGGLAHIGGA